MPGLLRQKLEQICGLSKPRLFILGGGGVLLLGWLHWLVIGEVPLTLFAVYIVGFAAWAAGTVPGIWTAGVTSLSFAAIEWASRTVVTDLAAPAWNAAVRLVICLLTVHWFDKSKRTRNEMEAGIRQRAMKLEEELRRRAQVETELRERADGFHVLVEHISEVFWISDPAKEQIFYVSPSYEKIWGRTCQSLYRSPRAWLEALHPEDRDRVLQAALHKQVAGDYDEEYRILRPDGSVRWIRDRAFPVRDETGNVTRITGVADDITVRKCLEAEILEIAANERRRLGHDLHDGLGQYLAGIALRTKALEQSLTEDDLPHAAEASDLAALVSNAIHQARILARGMDPVLFEGQGRLCVALQRLAAESEDLFHVRCGFFCAEGAVQLTPPVAVELYRIAQEAIHNAVVHGEARQIEIELSMEAGHLCLEIRDDGLGFRAKETDESGMGLRVMQYRARSIGASLSIQSAPHRGTEVRCLVRRTAGNATDLGNSQPQPNSNDYARST